MVFCFSIPAASNLQPQDTFPESSLPELVRGWNIIEGQTRRLQEWLRWALMVRNLQRAGAGGACDPIVATQAKAGDLI